jgi:uncharacterized protein YceK
MKRIIFVLLACGLLLSGCGTKAPVNQNSKNDNGVPA